MNKVKIVAETLAELREHYCLMGIERQPTQLKTADFDGSVIFSDDPKIATVPPAFFTVQTIQELKKLGGGNGGDGGNGGKGGNGGNIYFNYTSGTPTISAKSVSGYGGAKGYAGSRGIGGYGGSGSPSGSTGPNGVSGKDGIVGATGAVGSVYINGKKQ
ncbi:hypothetical protein QPK13_05510 [Photorhabdus tasmaniensis]